MTVEITGFVARRSADYVAVLLCRVEPRQMTAHVLARLLQRRVRRGAQHHVTVEVVALVAAALAVVVNVICAQSSSTPDVINRVYCRHDENG